MSLVNFRTVAEITIEDRLEQFKKGEVAFSMGNQFDEQLLESALSGMTSEKVEEAYNYHEQQKQGDWYKPWTAYDYANFFSTYNAPELDRGWID